MIFAVRSVRSVAAVAVALVGSLAAPCAAVGPSCAGDFDGSGAVGGLDLATLLGQWTGAATYAPCPPYKPADFNHDCRIDGLDLGSLLALWGPLPTFDFGPAMPEAEAAQIALEMLGPGGPLLPAPADYQRVDRDLDLIRAFEPSLAAETHSMAWAPNQLIVKVLTGVDQSQYQCYKQFYQVTSQQFLFTSGGGSWYTITFAGKLNVEALAGIFAALPEVDSAEPNGLIGGQNYWTVTPLAGGVWEWRVDDGSVDCFDGCDCHRVFTFHTDARGTVTLISYQQFGQSWCVF